MILAERYAKGMMARNEILHEKWHYENGCFLKGLASLYEETGNKEYFDFIIRIMDMFINAKGQIATYKIEEYNLDMINQGKILLYLYKKTGEERYKSAAYKLMMQLKNHPKTSEGIFFHKKMYPSQVWLDGLYMASPFLAEFIREFEYTKVYDEVIKQFTGAYKNTLDVKTGLLKHAWDESHTQVWANPITGQSPHTWSRALGWYMMALSDTLEIIPESEKSREYLIDILNALAEAVFKYCDKNTGCWCQVVECPEREGNYPEASGSVMIICALAKAVNRGYVDSSYKDKIKKLYDGFVKYFISENEEGYLDINYICSCAGLGSDPYRTGSYEYYIQEDISSNDYKCMGAFIDADIEISRF